MQDLFRRYWPHFQRGVRNALAIVWRAMVKYSETDGEQRAASFAYYAFFSLIPLLLVLIAGGTMVMGDQEQATERILDFMKPYIPVEYVPVEGGKTTQFSEIIIGVVKSRKSIGVIAFLALTWGAMRFFQALVRGVNKAWGTKEYSWWRLPIKNFSMFCIVASALFIGLLAPLAINLVEWLFWNSSAQAGLSLGWATSIFWLMRQIVPLLVLFYGFSMFYKFAPQRRTSLREVWLAALLVTFGLQVLQQLFVFYATNLSDFNRLYGALGGVVAFLMWIYLTGSIIIFGACLAAAKYEVRMSLTDQSEKSTF